MQNERETDRDRQTDRQKERERETERRRDRQTQREREAETMTERQRQTDREVACSKAALATKTAKGIACQEELRKPHRSRLGRKRDRRVRELLNAR